MSRELMFPQTVRIAAFSNSIMNMQWPYNPIYDGWWGHDTLPKLNYEESPKLEEYILEIAEKWVSPPYNVDGWRLDVAADLGFSQEYNHEFWRKFRRAVKEANPNAIILAEHYGDASSWLHGDAVGYRYELRCVYGTADLVLYRYGEAQRRVSAGICWAMREALSDAMRYHMVSFLAPSLQVAMNELSNHDHSRFLTRTNHHVGRVNHLGSDAASQ